MRSKLDIVNLAGSEHVVRIKSVDKTLHEAKFINTLLFFLETIIVALINNETKGKDYIHVPCQNSMITSMLRYPLRGNCWVTMITTISLEEE